jgi:hypothetical protein
MSSLLTAEVIQLIEANKGSKPTELAIKLSHLPSEERNLIVDQVRGRQKARDKFPFLLNFPNIVYPKGISLEQASSEETARFKSSLFSGKKALDLTAGFGIDATFIAKNFDEMTLVETDSTLLSIARHNFKEFQLDHVQFQQDTAASYIENLKETVDLIYLDPSRRIGGRKIFRIEDCEPDLLTLLPILRNKTEHLLVKLSPMADLQDIASKIPQLSSLYVVGLNGECKEILLIISRNKAFDGCVHCVELGKNAFDFSLSISEEKDLVIQTSVMKRYAYIPNVVLTKAGAFKYPVKAFHIDKISPNTHVYTSNDIRTSFPGKILECIATLPYNKSKLREITDERGFQVIKRNFPDDINGILKKLKIGLSGKYYLLAYRNYQDKPELAICQQTASS